MAQDFATSYAAILKADKNSDGTLTVYGKATSDDLDIDQQICDDSWLKDAMPEWFKTGGNIREQHSSIAAGVAKEYENKSDGHYITALVVDPTSIKKVETGVLKGFSIGIKSPRIIRDNKAANGRIVDGQIVEISLVDRPANPTCQLVLAKSVDGENTLTQVEDLIETQEKETPVEKSTLASSILELHKANTGNLVKYDQASYQTAINGIAQLIMGEASDIIGGADERDDIDTLLRALKHLFNFKDGEIDEDGDAAVDSLNLSAKGADSDGSAGCGCDGCIACQKAGGCDNKVCKGCSASKSADVGKCLECGCHQPGNAHGLTQIGTPGSTDGTATMSNVTTAATLNTDGSIKSAEGEETAEVVEAEAATEELKQEELPAEEETKAEETPAETEILDEAAKSAIIEKAVKSATESVKTEIAELQAATKAAQDKVMALESELVMAKSAAKAGGPKRTGRSASVDTNDLLVKAAVYRAKAAGTQDPTLIKGYNALAEEYADKAKKLNK